MNPLLVRALIALAAAVAIAIGSYAFGVRVEHNANEAQKAQDLQIATELHNAKVIAGDAIERETVQRAVKTEAVFNGIQQGLVIYAQKHPADTDCRLDADGLLIWNDANAGADVESVAERYATVRRGTPGSDERRNDGPAEQSRGSDKDVSPGVRTPQRPGQVAGEDKP